MAETREIDPVTGGEKGSKLARFDLIPPEFEIALAEHYGLGARKYADRNWERGYRWGLSYAALRRHLAAWACGESIDPESGSHHLVAVAWHAITLYIFERRGLGTDDRAVSVDPLDHLSPDTALFTDGRKPLPLIEDNIPF